MDYLFLFSFIDGFVVFTLLIQQQCIRWYRPSSNLSIIRSRSLYAIVVRLSVVCL